MLGIITFYINIHPEQGQELQQTVEIFKQCNKELFEKINDSDYIIAVVPTTKEACRVEKIDFDKPFPRSIPRHHVEIESLEKRKVERNLERQLEFKEREKKLLKDEE